MCLAGETSIYLAKKYAGIGPGPRHRLFKEIKEIADILQSQAELSQLQYPPLSTKPIPCLVPLKLDILYASSSSMYLNRSILPYLSRYNTFR